MGVEWGCLCLGRVCRWDRESVSWGESARSDRMRCIVAVALREVAFLGRCFLRVCYCISLLVVDMKCSTGIVRVCGGVNEVVAIEHTS